MPRVGRDAANWLKFGRGIYIVELEVPEFEVGVIGKVVVDGTSSRAGSD